MIVNGRVRFWSLLRVLGALTLVLTGCATTTFVVQQYAGEPLPSHRVAVLQLLPEDDALVVSLDGERLQSARAEPGTRIHVELLPGSHEVGVVSAGSPVQVSQRVRFLAEQGKYYRAIAQDTAPTAGAARVAQRGVFWAPRVVEVDQDTSETLKDVSVAAP